MDERRLDGIARLVAAGIARRRFAAGLAAAALGEMSQSPIARAGCKRVDQRCDKSNDCRDGAACKGGKCNCKNGRDECGGKCYKLDTDEKHCGDCDTACGAGETCCDGTCTELSSDSANCGACGTTCAESEECVAGACDPPPSGCPADAAFCSLEGPIYVCGAAGTNCACSPTTDGTILCGDLTTAGALCGQCQESADCVALGFGADSFCAKSVGDCCGPVLDNVCRRPCPA
jgi:hypothetical protein